MKTTKVLLCHPGTQYSPLLATQLAKQNLLYKFATGIVFPEEPTSWWWKAIHLIHAEKLLRLRLAKDVKTSQMYLMPMPELLAMFKQRFLGQSNDPVFYIRNKTFQVKLPKRLIHNADVVIGFDTSSWILVERSHQSGKKFILDASIAHPLAKEDVYTHLRNKYPQWHSELVQKRQKNIDVELQEMDKADHIVAASSFTKNTYIKYGIPSKKISINPYGTGLNIFSSKWDSNTLQIRKPKNAQGITFFFFGSITARKGFPWLCEVWEKFHNQNPSCKLIAAGYGKPPKDFVLPAGIELIGAIHPDERTKWFHKADVFVFPSFFEGFAQVIIEAMACGLPIITTTHTAAPDMIESGIQGFIIAPGNDDELLDALNYFADNELNIEIMGRAARKAVLPFTWHAYGERWKSIITTVLAEK